MEIQVTNKKHLLLLATASDEHDEVDFESTAFEHSEEDDFEDQVREIALQDVMTQKGCYESSLGLELKAINFFYEGISQMARGMPRAMMSQEMALNSNGRGTPPQWLCRQPHLSHRHLMTYNARRTLTWYSKSSMRISYLSLLSFLIFTSTVGAAEIRDANRLLLVSNVASQFESMTLLQTRNIIRTYTSIVAISAGVELPQWIKMKIAACYEKTFAWEKFEDGVAQILLDNFSNHEMLLLTDFYRSEGLPPTEIPSFKAAIAKGEMIQQLTADYILANSDGCAGHDIDLILGFLADP